MPSIVPGGVLGDTTTVGMCWSPLPSSHVTNSAVVPDAYSGLARIWLTYFDSHVSPVCTPQSCVLLHMFGVISVNFAETSTGSLSGTLNRSHSLRMLV